MVVYIFPIFLMISFFIAMLSGSAQARDWQAEPFVMHGGPDPMNPNGIWLRHTYREVFGRMNIPVRFVHLPYLRASHMVNQGAVDGQIMRIYEYQDMFLDQRRVEEAVVSTHFVAIVRKEFEFPELNGWDSLSGKDIRAQHMRGVVFSRNNLEQTLNPKQVSAVDSGVDGLTNVKYQLSDVFVISEHFIQPYMELDEFKEDLRVAGLMENLKLYPYVHADHTLLVPEIAAKLVELKQEGLLFQFCIEAYGEGSERLCESIQP